MKVGETINPLYVGHSPIDVKGMLKEAGYITPQGTVSELKEIPADIKAKIEEIEKKQDVYKRGEFKQFTCSFCKTINGSEYITDTVNAVTFLACGACNKIVEVQ